MAPTACFSHEMLDDLLICVTVAPASGSAGLSPQDTSRWLEMMETEKYSRFLSCVVGSVTSSSTERKRGAEILKNRSILSAVVTDDAIVRGIVTAVSWLGANTRAFSWKDTDRALDFLGIEGSAKSHALDVLAEVRSRAEASVAQQ